VNGEATRSCAITIGDVQGQRVTTIEGLAGGKTLHPVQAAFAKHDALQCGYCTPGMIMNAAAILQNRPKATRQEIISGMEDNLCRCAAHKRIVEALEELTQG
jgi:carbon-monoxide dehydrogenase small subunit